MGNVYISTGLARALAVKGNLKELLTDFVLEIFSGSVPSSADAAESGTKLVTVTTDGNSWSASTAQVSKFNITALGSDGDTITVTIQPTDPSGNNEQVTYTKTSSDDSLLKLAQSVAAAINSDIEMVRAVATSDGSEASVVVTSRYPGDSFNMTVSATGSITVSSVTELVASSKGNGLHFESHQNVSAGVIEKSSDTWKGTILNTGTASYFRLKAHSDNGAESTTALRIQGAVGTTTGVPLQLSGSTTLTKDTELTIGSFYVEIPLSGSNA